MRSMSAFIAKLVEASSKSVLDHTFLGTFTRQNKLRVSGSKVSRTESVWKDYHLQCDVFNLHVCWAKKLAWCRMVEPEVDCETCMIYDMNLELRYIFLFVTRVKEREGCRPCPVFFRQFRSNPYHVDLAWNLCFIFLFLFFVFTYCWAVSINNCERDVQPFPFTELLSEGWRHLH